MAREPRKWTKADAAAEERWRAAMLAERRCPDSGMDLQRTELPDGPLFACGICDCAGYPGKEVGGGSGTGS